MSVRTIPGPVAQVLISDPRTRNALSTSVLRGIAAAVAEFSDEGDTRVIVLAGDGGTFSSGAHTREVVPIDEVIDAVSATYTAIAQSPKPVLARVEGNCLGLAVGIMAACDLAIAARETHFALPEARLGQAPTMAALTVVPRLRPVDASHLFLTGAAFGGERARDIGLVNDSVPAVELDLAVQRWTDQLIQGGPGALAVCKRLVRTLPLVDAAHATSIAADLTRGLAESPEAREGREAFSARRPPAWALRRESASDE